MSVEAAERDYGVVDHGRRDRRRSSERSSCAATAGTSMTYRVATDVGGTFTDLAAFDSATNELVISKASTTPDVKDGVADAVDESQARPRRDRLLRPRQHGRDQHRDRAQGRADGPAFHRGLPRHARDRARQHHQLLRSDVHDGRAARAAQAPARNHANACLPTAASLRPLDAEQRDGRAAPAGSRRRRSDRGLPAPLLRQSRTRARAQRTHAAHVSAAGLPFDLLGYRARVSRIRADLDGGAERLCRPAREPAT